MILIYERADLIPTYQNLPVSAIRLHHLKADGNTGPILKADIILFSDDITIVLASRINNSATTIHNEIGDAVRYAKIPIGEGL